MADRGVATMLYWQVCGGKFFYENDDPA